MADPYRRPNTIDRRRHSRRVALAAVVLAIVAIAFAIGCRP